MKFKTIALLLLLLMVGSVSAFTITRNSPAQYSIQNDTTVIFNLTAVDTGGSSTITCGVYNKTNRTGAYSLGASYNATNATATDNLINLTIADDTRVWWKASCWDQTSEFSTTLEAQTVPAINTIVNLANDANGVSAVSMLVNYTQDVVNETSTLPVNGSTFALAGNGTITAVSSVYANVTGGAYALQSSASYSLDTATGLITLLNASIAGNTSLVSYTFKNETWLTGANWNVTDGFVYMNTSTYAGDDSWWNYSYPLNEYVNQENTSIRVLDVDDYYSEFINVWVPIRLVPQAQGTCDSSSEGAIYYDSTNKGHYGCNVTAWNRLY